MFFMYFVTQVMAAAAPAPLDATLVSLRSYSRTEACVLIVGAHPDEASRFEAAFPDQKIVYWNHSYNRDGGSQGVIPEKFVAGPGASHIFADFNEEQVLQQVSQAAAGLFSQIWFDKGVIGYTRWTKKYWKHVLATLNPTGKLFFDMKLKLSSSFFSCPFNKGFSGNSQGRREGWSHTTKALADLFQGSLTSQDRIVLNLDGFKEIAGYYTYNCQKPLCTSACWQTPATPTCLVPDGQPNYFTHNEAVCTGICKETRSCIKICSHDDHQCEAVCIDSAAILKQWDDLLKSAEEAFFPSYVQFVQEFLDNQYVVEASASGYPFELGPQQKDRCDPLLVQVSCRSASA